MKYRAFDVEGQFIGDVIDKSLGLPAEGDEILLEDGIYVIRVALKEQIDWSDISLFFPIVVSKRDEQIQGSILLKVLKEAEDQGVIYKPAWSVD